MSKLMKVLKTGVAEDKKEHQIPFTNRYKNEDGSPVLATVTAISARQNNNYRQQAMRTSKKDINFDSGKYQTLIVVNHVKDPDFKNKADIDEMGVASAEDLANLLLNAGEFETLAKGILEISGFDEDFDDIKNQVKN